jgi:hypothetical protein
MRLAKEFSGTQRLGYAVAAALGLATGSAAAEPPANLGNTAWTLQVNRDVDQLVITSQSGPGAPGADTCRIINGELGVAKIRGWYCPDTGRIVFVHKNAGSGNAVRVFAGSLSDQVAGESSFMAGTVAILDASFGDYGEYNFSAFN